MLLSGRGEPQAVAAQESLRASAAGAALTVVRSAFFARNFSEGAMLDGVLGSEVVFPAGGTAELFVDVDDLADVVVAALTEDGHAGAVHELTGLLTFDEVVSEIARATGRAVRYLPVSGPAYTQILERYGAPGPKPVSWPGCSRRCSTAATRR